MRELSKFKVLGITLLVTMSSCVTGTLNIDTNTLRSYGFEFDLPAQDKNHTNYKYKRQKTNNNPKFSFKPLIESGRNNKLVKGLSLDHFHGLIRLSSDCFVFSSVVQLITDSEISYLNKAAGSCILTRAGPYFI